MEEAAILFLQKLRYWSRFLL